MPSLKELLQKKRDKEAEAKQHPKGRRQRRIYREKNDLMLPGEYIGYQLHPKNAACRRKYLQGKARLDAQKESLTDEQYDAALEDLQSHYAHRVPIWGGLNARVRKQMRSEYLKAARLEKEKEDVLESGSRGSECPPSDDFEGDNA